MKLDIMDIEKFIKLNDIKEVTSHLFFDKTGLPDPNGLFSYDIFGLPGSSDRKEKWGYIDLKTVFIHPHIYKLLISVNRKYANILTSSQYFKFNEKIGDFEKVDDPSKGRTGIDFFYENFDKIVLRDTESRKKSDRLDLLKKLRKEDIFIKKWLVIPAFYRDISFETRDKNMSINKINSLYKQLIVKTKSLSMLINDVVGGYEYTKSNIQGYLNETYDHFIGMLKLKYGFIHQGILRKNVDYGVRSIITAPSFDANSWKDLPADFKHISLPLTQAMTLFIVGVVSKAEIVLDHIMADKRFIYIDSNKFVHIDKNWKDDWTYEKIIKLIDLYITTPEIRFDPVKIRMSDGSYGRIALDKSLTFLDYSSNKNDFYRFYTLTDLFYMATLIETTDKHVLITRYPADNLHSEYFAKVKIRSTYKTVVKKPDSILHNKIIYDYPYIEPDIKKEDIVSRFIDTLELFPPYIKMLGADHDGDMVVLRGLWDKESNIDADRYINSPLNCIGLSGSSSRTPGDVGEHTLYNLTRDEPNAKVLDEKGKEFVLSITDDMITKDFFIENFSVINGKPPKYDVSDKFTLTPKDVMGIFDLDSPIETTIGRYIFNIFINRGCFGNTFKYYNEQLDSKGFSKFDKMVSIALLDGKINVSENYHLYMTKRSWLEYTLPELLVPGADCKLFILPKEVIDRKNELLEKYKDRIKEGDPVIAAEIEKELLELNKKLQANNPAMRLYNLKKPSYGNNYKNMAVMIGPLKSNLTETYRISTTNYFEGFDIDEFEMFADTSITGTYNRAVETQVGGAATKEVVGGLSTLEIDPDQESDCGTEYTKTVLLDEKVFDYYLYRYIVDRGNLVLLTYDNKDKYINTIVKMRDPLYCNGDKICAKCMGLFYYKLGTTAVGITLVTATGALTNRAMKAKHDISIQNYDLKFWKFFDDK